MCRLCKLLQKLWCQTRFRTLANLKISKGVFSLQNEISENGKNLSGGEIQRIAIARALYNDAELIIFDEPTSNLDYDNTMLIEKLINSLRKNKTIFVISHDKNLFKESEVTIEL